MPNFNESSEAIRSYSPGDVLLHHTCDELANFRGQGRTTAARFPATTPKGAGIEAKILRPHPERPGELRSAVSTVHRLNPLELGSIEPVRRQSAPVIVLAIYLCAQKLYLAIYRRKWVSIASG